MTFENLKIGDVVFRMWDKNEDLSENKWHFLNFLIAQVTKTRIKEYPFLSKELDKIPTHVGILVDIDDENYYINEAGMNGVKTNKYSKVEFKSKLKKGTWCALRIPKLKTKIIKEIAETLQFVPYGFLDYIKFILFYVTGKKLFPGTGWAMVCSESVSFILSQLGVEIRYYDELMYKFDYLAPLDVYCRLILNHNSVILR